MLASGKGRDYGDGDGGQYEHLSDHSDSEDSGGRVAHLLSLSWAGARTGTLVTCNKLTRLTWDLETPRGTSAGEDRGGEGDGGTSVC